MTHCNKHNSFEPSLPGIPDDFFENLSSNAKSDWSADSRTSVMSLNISNARRKNVSNGSTLMMIKT